MSSTIEINDDFMTLESIKNQFNKKYPHLKIEFFETKYTKGEASPKELVYDGAFRIKDIRKEGAMVPISIHENLKTSTLEKLFEEELGLHIQVYKKSNNTWVQIMATDNWTLSQQETDMLNQKDE
ncbi:MAG: hypothetical protein COA32_09665 [Fluviicola sp.]|nr:MAG: hypothetical protein COA32_09665 [Fluviicola sp.]